MALVFWEMGFLLNGCLLGILLFFQYAVASGSIASVHKPLLRLEIYVSKSSSQAEEAGLGRVFPENHIQTTIAEFTTAQLDTFIATMEAIDQVLCLHSAAENRV